MKIETVWNSNLLNLIFIFESPPLLLSLKRIIKKHHMSIRILTAFTFIMVFIGCHSYIQRTVWQSFSRLCDTIPSPTHSITNPEIPDAKLTVSWIGHATVLIQIHDKYFITDPLFSNTIGLLVKRYVKVGIDPNILPKIDFTVISHLHLDHFSFSGLDAISKNGTLVVPDGSAAYTPEFDFGDFRELKSWEAFEKDGVRITAVPVQHFTGRYGFDVTWLGEKGYTGYVLEYCGITVFFAGDTGYDPDLFKEIGKQFKIDLAIVPIAPSSSTGLGGHVHVSPSGALEIMKDTGAKYLLPVHYGAFLYGSTSNPLGPLERLLTEARTHGVFEQIIGLEVGQQRVLF